MEGKFKEYPCDICGSDDAVEVPHAREYTDDQPIHICKECGFVYVRFRRDPEEVARAWSDELYGGHYQPRIPAVKARQAYTAEFIDVSIGIKDKALTDIGAGEGQFLVMARDEYGAKGFGIEPSPSNGRILEEKKVDHFVGTIEDYVSSGEKRTADIVTIMWTLENCTFCRNMLEAAYDLLEPGGHLAVSTGSRILVPFKKPLNLYIGNSPADTNCFRFSANTLRGILAVCGFEVTHINRYIDTDYLSVIAIKREKGAEISWEGDNWKAVSEFFERWHEDTKHYA